MIGHLRNLRPFWSRLGRALRGPQARLTDEAIATADRALDLAEGASVRIGELEAERDKAVRQRDAFAVEVDELREHVRTVAAERDAAPRAAVELAEKLSEYRRVIAAQAGEIRRVWAEYEQAHRNTVLEHDRVLTLQKANEDLTRELAELRREAAPYGVIA